MARIKTASCVLSPDQVHALGRVTSDDLKSAADITRQLLEAEHRRAAASEARRAAMLPPPANRGGKSPDGSEYVKLVMEDGKIKQVLSRRGYGGSAAFIDWINFTIGAETFDDDDCSINQESLDLLPITEEQYVVCASRALASIFGYGVTEKLGYGQHFYDQTYSLGDKWGTLSIGGQNQTILVSISGAGLSAAREGWEVRLKTFLENSDRSRITRVDLAHDDYAGSTYTVDKADQDHTDGLYNCGGRNPRCEYRGDWKNPDGKGRSFYIGNRKNGKFCRVYEKGRELGSPSSDWVRVEVEFKSVDRVIPFAVLTAPGEYLAAAYPAFAWINEHQERIETTQKVTQANVEKAMKWLKHQCGAYVHHLTQLFGVEEFVKRVSRDDKEPAFMKVPHFGLAGPGIHQTGFHLNPANLSAAATAW